MEDARVFSFMWKLPIYILFLIKLIAIHIVWIHQLGFSLMASGRIHLEHILASNLEADA